MMKKVLLIAAALILAISCSKSPTDPNNNNDTGDGGLIDEGSGTKDPTTISDFLKNHSGRYYYQYDKSISIRERIEDGKIYNDMYSSEENLEITGTMTLLDNKLQIETTSYSEPLNKVIYLYVFNNNVMNKYTKYVYEKEPISSTVGYKQLTKVNGLEKYAGTYYNYYYSSSEEQPPQPEKSINIIIDNNGYIYAPIPEQVQVQIKNIKLNSNNLIMEISQTITENEQTYTYNVEQSIIFKDNFMIDDYVKVNGEYQGLDECKKSDLLTPYIGNYNSTDGSNISLMVESSSKVTLIISSMGYTSGILLGNTLTVLANISENNYKEYVIVFSEDKQTATYTDPDTKKEITLTKQTA